MTLNRRIRMGMVGGGAGAFIGDVHRKAAALDGQIELVCGAFSRSAENSSATGESLFLDPERAYGSWQQMLETERRRAPGQRMELVSIVTPNDVHLPVARAALEAGFHVISDKPATRDLAEALELRSAIESANGLYALTHTYLGYPLVKEARDLVARGELGALRKIYVEYPQGWLSTLLEATGQKQADWRTDPQRSGPSGCMGDIGTHAATLAEYIAGDFIAEVCADLTIFVEGRRLDDDGAVLFRTTGGAKGVLTASQVCSGEENNLNIRVYGERGGLQWRQQEPNTLWLKRQGEPARRLRAGVDQGYLGAAAHAHMRTPSGHPEGYFEAFANIYRNFAYAIAAHDAGERHDPVYDYPTIREGVSGLAFIDAIIRNNRGGEKWTAVSRH